MSFLSLGRLRVWLDRVVGYLSLLNFLMVLYLFVSNDPLGILWYYWIIAGVVLVLAVIVVDIKFIYPQAQSYISDLNPRWLLMEESLRRLERKLDDNKAAA